MKLPPGLGDTDSVVNLEEDIVRVAGNRKPVSPQERYARLLLLAQPITGGKTALPKGVFRFKTHEEANQWEMNQILKQTLREKDIPDKVFLRQWAVENGVTLDPPVGRAADSVRLPAWLQRLLHRLFGRG